MRQKHWKALALVLSLAALAVFVGYRHYWSGTYNYLYHAYIEEADGLGCELVRVRHFGLVPSDEGWDAVYFCDPTLKDPTISSLYVDYWCRPGRCSYRSDSLTVTYLVEKNRTSIVVRYFGDG